MTYDGSPLQEKKSAEGQERHRHQSFRHQTGEREDTQYHQADSKHYACQISAGSSRKSHAGRFPAYGRRHHPQCPRLRQHDEVKEQCCAEDNQRGRNQLRPGDVQNRENAQDNPGDTG